MDDELAYKTEDDTEIPELILSHMSSKESWEGYWFLVEPHGANESVLYSCIVKDDSSIPDNMVNKKDKVSELISDVSGKPLSEGVELEGESIKITDINENKVPNVVKLLIDENDYLPLLVAGKRTSSGYEVGAFSMFD
jgi:hypothetical protein